MITSVKQQLKQIIESSGIETAEYRSAKMMYINGNCQVLSRSANGFEVLVDDEDGEGIELRITAQEDETLQYLINGKPAAWDSYGVAALMQVDEELEKTNPKPIPEGKAYTREGMVKRVLNERRAKALKAKYTIVFADNIYGEHLLTTEKGVRYKITLRDFKNETGYIDNPDLKSNKLGVTKHLMFAFAALKADTRLYKKLSKVYPFVEIYLDPLNSYRITWHYPHQLKPAVAQLIDTHFKGKTCIEEHATGDFLNFIVSAREFPHIIVRPEVDEKVKRHWDKEMLALAQNEGRLDFSLMKTALFPYQEEGVAFATFKEGAIIADEMGLGKTIQAIATAVMKKKLFGFTRTLIICPASLKEQWKQEIEKFCNEEAVIADGPPEQRFAVYRDSKAYFVIVNYETVLRDWREMNRMETDFIILDEAQKIKNFATITSQSIKLLEKKHALVITGTPIENRLIDLYSIVQFIDPQYLAPLWEFSYQYCYFDETKADKITGYYNLQQLNERLKPILLRREKRKVIKELPKVTEITVPVDMHPEQAMHHANYAKGIASILRKKFISPFDLQKLMLLMSNMRMVCDSTFLVDKESYISPKLYELKHILMEKLDLPNNNKKVIIFSEWVTMLNLIGKMLHECGIGFSQLSGQVAIRNRDKLVKKFESEDECQVFLSTEAGGAGLNLQVADTVINFEVPWNPAKKNQRIGRIDRLGQLSKHLTVINLITKNSIEIKIASGLTLKQNLFDGVLNTDNGIDEVDFSASGKSQFLKEMESVIEGFMAAPPENFVPDETETIPETIDAIIADEGGPQFQIADEVTETAPPLQLAQQEQMETMAKVMNQGMDFLSGMFKMATGKDLGFEGKKMEIDKETGEFVMRFKVPGF